ncbi:MAG: signal peptidase II [Parcubacteria group bacterium]
MSRTYKIAWMLGGVAIIVFDQLTKLLARNFIPDSGIFIFDNNIASLKLVYWQNPFIAFGIKLPLLDARILPIITIAILLFIVYKATRQENIFVFNCAILVAAGAISNVADRLINHGGVTDFLSFSFLRVAWPAFNLADMIITITAISFLIVELTKKNYEKH